MILIGGIAHRRSGYYKEVSVPAKKMTKKEDTREIRRSLARAQAELAVALKEDDNGEMAPLISAVAHILCAVESHVGCGDDDDGGEPSS